MRDDSQPFDRADQAATARDGMSQLWVSLESPLGGHVHHGNAHRLDTTCNCESPTTSLYLPRVITSASYPPASAAAAAHATFTYYLLFEDKASV